jgi:hypothetical protein
MLAILLQTLISALQTHRALAVENPALRHQLLVLQRSTRKPRLRRTDRILWVLLSRLGTGWQESLAIVRPETWKAGPASRLEGRWPGRKSLDSRVQTEQDSFREIRDLETGAPSSSALASDGVFRRDKL